MISLPDDPRLDIATPLSPGNAVAAILTAGDRYLMQLRDRKYGIFFPDHWGCFGGSAEPGESFKQTLTRELKEELQLKLSPDQIRHFTRFDFDLGFAKLKPIWRIFYEASLTHDQLSNMSLSEGSDMRLFTVYEILTGAIPITPYDAFALWLHINQNRLTSS